MTTALPDIELLSEFARRLGAQEERTAALADSLREYLEQPVADPDATMNEVFRTDSWLDFPDADDGPEATIFSDIRPLVPGADTVVSQETPPTIPGPVDRPLPAAAPDHVFHAADVLDAVPQAVVELDATGRVGVWNRAAERMFGWPAAAALGRPPQFVPPDRLTDHHRMLCQARAGAGVRESVAEYRRNTGEKFKAVVAAVPHAGGGVVFAFRPWAGLERPPEAAVPAAAPPDRRLETVGRLVAAVTNDFSTLLNVIGVHAESLHDQMTVLDDRRDYVRVIGDAAGRGVELSRRLLNLARPAAGDPVPVDVSVTVAELSGLLKSVAGGGVMLRLNPAPDPGLVFLDPTLVEQILLNLVANARDAVGPGGSIGVRTGRVFARGTPCVLITVADTGMDAESEDRAQIYMPFFTTRPGGSDVGLSAVRETAAKAGGWVELDSDLGRGTVVRVFLPAVPEAANAEPDEPLFPEGRGRTVLIVDPDDAARAAHRRALEAAGCDVLESTSADAALLLSRAILAPLDLLVADRRAGRALAEKLRKGRSELRVVYTGGPPVPADPLAGCVAKDCPPEELLAAVRASGRKVFAARVKVS